MKVTNRKNKRGSLDSLRLNYKGFTLIELLGVIIVLAAIALITVPIIGNIMKDSRKNSFKTSMNHLVQAANNYYADHQLELEKTVSFDYGTRGGKNEDGVELSFSGTKPTGGRVVVTLDGGVTLLDVTNGTYYANYDSLGSEDLVITDDNEIMTRDELTEAIKELRAENKKMKEQLASTTTIANTANTTANSLNSNFLNKTYPVGSIYVSNKNTNPSSVFGGTWVAFGTGRTLVGVNTSDSNFNTVEKTGGANTVTLSTANLPSHSHTVTAKGSVSSTFTGSSVTTSSDGSHAHNFRYGTGSQTYSSVEYVNGRVMIYLPSNGYGGTQTAGVHTHTVTAKGTVSSTFTGSSATTSSVGSGSAVTNLQPYITVYMWKRTA